MMDLLRSMAAAGRTIPRRTSSRRSSGSPTACSSSSRPARAAGDFREIRRLMTDRPHTFVVRSSDDRRLAAAFMTEPAVFGTELRDGHLQVGSGSSPASPERGPRRPRRIGVAARGLPDRRLARERLRLPGVAAMIFATLRRSRSGAARPAPDPADGPARGDAGAARAARPGQRGRASARRSSDRRSTAS